MIHHADWRDVLPGIYDPERAVVVTDPPFGLRGKGAGIPGDRHSVGRGFDDDRPWADHVAEVLALLPAARHVIRGPARAFVADHPRPRRLCIEVARGVRRTIYRPNTVDHAWTGWAVYGSLRVVNRHRGMPRDVCIIDSVADDGAGASRVSGDRHLGRTPMQSALWAVSTWAPPGWLVLDPFAGTGTIGRAALELGCLYVGAEVDERWIRVADAMLGATPLRLGLGA